MFFKIKNLLCADIVTIKMLNMTIISLVRLWFWPNLKVKNFIPKLDKHITRKESYRPMYLIKVHEKILNKTLIN